MVKRELLMKTEEETDPSYGCAPSERPIDVHMRYGIINLDKPAGPTSHQVVAWVKQILHAEHAGHSGTLDPLATGVLPIALGDGAKALQALLLTGKEYVCLARFHKALPQKALEGVMREFVGEIYQRPPVRSAVSRRVRTRTIYGIEFLELSGSLALFKVICEAGTYMRKLVNDMGEVVSVGAHLKELRRTIVGPFSEDDSFSLYDVAYAYSEFTDNANEKPIRKIVRPIEDCLSVIPKVYIKDSAVDAVCHGASLAAPGILKVETGINRDDAIGAFTLKGEVVALMKSAVDTTEMLEMDRGIIATPLRIIMSRGTYPRRW
jgi:H/ACA ribonucleoprotein complex subunit 4